MTEKQLAIAAGAAGLGLMAYAADKAWHLRKDFTAIRKLLVVKKGIDSHLKNNDTWADVWEEAAKKHAKSIAFIFEGKTWTYDAVEKAANRVANWALGQGVKQKDVVALLMENRPEYVITWLGLLKVGAIVALINTNLKDKPLLHSLTISKAKTLILGSECAEPVADLAAALRKDDWKIWSLGGTPEFARNLDAELGKSSDKTPPRKIRDGCKFSDVALLVYTSGTTGLPKAATIKHLRLFSMGFGFTTMFAIQSTDRIYCVLPLYHSAGGLVGVGMMMTSGGTLVLKRKFSASQFWPDCREHKVTVMQYIGELCRYLLNVPADANDGKQQTVRIAIGNGLRPDIWETFQKRFNIPEVGEFYGSTEGNIALFNHCTDVRSRGSVGHSGPILSKAMKAKLVQFDVQKEEPVRNKQGFAVECKKGEAGELLAEIDDKDPIKGFAGYYGNAAATKSKVMTDVFKKGDKYFRTGDLLKQDNEGYWYFVDRIGDTFRWKGENVSTTEVAEALSVFPGIEEVNVYGVEIPGGDGRACMAAIIAADNLDFKGLYAHCAKVLPPYAVPLFLRKLPKIDVTGTFKHQKVELRNQGISPAKCLSDGKPDPIFRIADGEKTYTRFSQAEFNAMSSAAPRSKL